MSWCLLSLNVSALDTSMVNISRLFDFIQLLNHLTSLNFDFEVVLPQASFLFRNFKRIQIYSVQRR